MIARLVTATEKQRASVKKVLTDALAEAERGNITKVLVVAWHDDNRWTDWMSEHASYCDAIGKLDIVKGAYLMRFFDQS